MLPNKGKSGEHTLCNIKCEVVYTGTKHWRQGQNKKRTQTWFKA